MIHSTVTVCTLSDPPFSVNNTAASDAPLIGFVTKEPSRLISILRGKYRKTHILKWSCSNFTLTLFLHAAGGNGCDLTTSNIQKQR